jgi:hypothetical protein
VSPGGTTQRWIHGAAGDAIALDERWFPVLISTWFGAAGEDSVREYFRWLGEQAAGARAQGVPLVNVTDTGPAGLPAASVRRLIADLTLEWERRELQGVAVHAYVVIESALLRGTLNALAWMHGAMRAVNVGSLREALERAEMDLVRAGAAVPKGFDPQGARRAVRGR